ncbi:MAG TPA: hypothetical protein VLK35_02155 [Methylomirabilota bacterium]|nr:hypothetical protein [Methylomirabilota bacterium]
MDRGVAMQLAERFLGAHAPRLAESAREHLRLTCRAVGADPDAAEVRAREAWEAKLALARESVLPASGSLAETYDEERLRVCRGGSAS